MERKRKPEANYDIENKFSSRRLKTNFLETFRCLNRPLALRSHVILSAMLEGKQIGCYGKHGCRVGSRKVSYATIYANSFFVSEQNDLYSLFKYA